MRQLGFAIAAPPANDPDYPQGNLHCVGAIVFGADGASAARTVSTIVPCTQFVRDDRQADSVDLILGGYFTWLASDSAALEFVSQLDEACRAHSAQNGGLQAAPDQPPPISFRLLSAARSNAC